MRRRVIILVVMIIVAMSLNFAFRQPAAGPLPKVQILDQGYVMPQPRVSLFDQWVPRRAGWGWLWKLKETVAGKPRQFTLSFTVVDLSTWNESALTNLGLPAPAVVGTNGVRAWLLANKALVDLRSELKQKAGGEIISVVGVTTYDGGEARLTTGDTKIVNGRPAEAGLFVDVLPRVTRPGFDIAALITQSEFLTNQMPAGDVPGIRTNSTLGARVQLGGNEGVFLLDGDPAGTGQRRIGVMLSGKAFGKP